MSASTCYFGVGFDGLAHTHMIPDDDDDDDDDDP